MIKVYIVEDHDLMRDNIRVSFDKFDDICVAGDAASGEEFIAALGSTQVDIVLLDIALPKMQGYDVAHYLRRHHPEIKILAVSCENDHATVQKMFDAGMEGFVSKQQCRTNELVEAIYTVMSGLVYFTRDISTILHHIYLSKKKTTVVTGEFTEQERRVIELSSEKLPAKLIADRLNISIRTVEKHKQSIFNKLGINSTAEMVAYAMSKGIIRI